MVAVFGNPVQHSEARDEISSVEQGRVLSEQGVDVGPGACCPLHQPDVLLGLQRNQRLMTGTNISLFKFSPGNQLRVIVSYALK